MPRYVVRYGIMRGLAVVTVRGSDRMLRGTRVLARTPRGMEVGEVLCEATDAVVSQLPNAVYGQIVREMTSQDEHDLTHVLAEDRSAFDACNKYIHQLGIPMQVVDIEHIFGGERVVIYYISDQRVDFRELVKLLASEFQTRVEMRQIGVRDEAKLLADYGDCGQPVCCNTFLSEMPPVSMKMAKLQKATLDPTKISGRCGRLKCCLRYEYDTYEAIHKELPPVGSEVLTRAGRAVVLGQEILAEQLLVETEDRRRVLIPATDVLTVVRRGKGKPRRGDEDFAAGTPDGTEDKTDHNRGGTSDRANRRGKPPAGRSPRAVDERAAADRPVPPPGPARVSDISSDPDHPRTVENGPDVDPEDDTTE